MPHPPHKHNWAGVRFVSGSNVCTLAFLLYDILITLDDEVDTIWSKPNRLWIKWQFLFTRYFGLAVQIVNCAITVKIARCTRSEQHAFKDWYMSQVIVSNVLMTAVEMILMLRVYALYNRSAAIALLFLAFLIAKVAATVAGMLLNIPGTEYDTHMLLLVTPDSFTYLGLASIASQITIITLTLIKYRSAVQSGWAETPIITLMMRDGTIAFLTMTLTCVYTVILTVLDSHYAPIGYFWLLSIVSSAGCRLIINMQRLATSESPNRSTALHLTTVLSDSDSASYI